MDLPGLYGSFDSASIHAQRNFRLLVGTAVVCGTLAAGLATVGAQPDCSSKAIWSAVVAFTLLSSLCSVTVLVIRPEHDWYTGRALAESTKTLAWKYAMRADPFQAPDREAGNAFGVLMNQLLAYAKNYGLSIPPPSADAITPEMSKARQMPWQDRLSLYLDSRIEGQKRWYSTKCQRSRRSARFWLWSIVALYVLAFLAGGHALLAGHEAVAGVVGTFTTAAAGCIAWLQVVRSQETAKSYSLTAHELSLVEADARGVLGEADVAAFVTDSESAISREHSTWLSRREVRHQLPGI